MSEVRAMEIEYMQAPLQTEFTALEAEAITGMIAQLASEVYSVRIGKGNGTEIDDVWFETYIVEILNSQGHIVATSEAPLLVEALTDAYGSTPEAK
jgi:hypothetical protein